MSKVFASSLEAMLSAGNDVTPYESRDKLLLLNGCPWSIERPWRFLDAIMARIMDKITYEAFTDCNYDEAWELVREAFIAKLFGRPYVNRSDAPIHPDPHPHTPCHNYVINIEQNAHTRPTDILHQCVTTHETHTCTCGRTHTPEHNRHARTHTSTNRHKHTRTHAVSVGVFLCMFVCNCCCKKFSSI